VNQITADFHLQDVHAAASSRSAMSATIPGRSEGVIMVICFIGLFPLVIQRVGDIRHHGINHGAVTWAE